MKIAFIGGRDIHKLGGIEAYMYNLCSELVKLGHEPIVFCESDHDGEEELNGFRVIHKKEYKSNLICKPILGLKSTIHVIRKIKDVDVIHYNAWPASLWNPLARLYGITTLMQGHGLEWQRTKYSKMAQRIMKFMEWFTAHTNQHLIMCSNAQTRYFKKHYNKDAVTIPTAINPPDTQNHNDIEILNKYSLAPKEYFIFMARLVKDKNPDILIQAFVDAKHSGKKLVIAGNNDANPEYVNFLHDIAKDHDDLVFTGAVYGDTKEALLRNAYAFCLVSSIEGLSISLLEAMGYSLPIIASDIEANREVLTDDDAFWVHPENTLELKEAIEKCSYTNEKKLQEMTSRNYSKVIPDYTWHEVAKRYIEYLKTIV